MTWVSEPTGQLSMFIQLLGHPRAFVRAEITRLNVKRCNMNAKYVCEAWVVKMGQKTFIYKSFCRLDGITVFLLQLTYHSRLPITSLE